MAARTMPVVGVGIIEDGLLEVLDGIVHLVRLDVGLELREVVNGALAVGGGDHVGRVLPDVLCDLAPCRFDGGNRVGECSILSTHWES